MGGAPLCIAGKPHESVVSAAPIRERTDDRLRSLFARVTLNEGSWMNTLFTVVVFAFVLAVLGRRRVCTVRGEPARSPR